MVKTPLTRETNASNASNASDVDLHISLELFTDFMLVCKFIEPCLVDREKGLKEEIVNQKNFCEFKFTLTTGMSVLA